MNNRLTSAVVSGADCAASGGSAVLLEDSDWLRFCAVLSPAWYGKRVAVSSLNRARDILLLLTEVKQPNDVARCVQDATRGWPRRVAQRILSVLRNIMRRLHVPGTLVSAVQLAPLDWNPCLPKMYGRLAPDNPERKRCEAWVRKRHVNESNLTTRRRLALPSKQRKRKARDAPLQDWDAHRVSNEDLEKLYACAQRDPLNELFFLTLLTTGMRVGGLVRMRCADVADLQEGRWHARREGTTLEKGGRWHRFLLRPRVGELLEAWLNRDRPFHPGPFVFPAGCGPSHASTAMFRKRFAGMCRAAGVHTHLHALRHSFAHLLIETGHAAEHVAKLLGHADPFVTRRHYLQESAAQVAERAVIPWVTGNQRERQRVPTFLRECTASSSSVSMHKERMRRARDTVQRLQECFPL